MTKRVVILTNLIAPYRVPLFEALEERLADLKILVSTQMEPNRSWPVEWGGLQVEVQRNCTFRRTWKHPHGFAEPLFVHVPYDTLWRLWRYRPEVVISGEMGMRTLQAAVYRLLRSESRLIVWATLSEYTEQGQGKAGKVRRALRRWLLRTADAVLVNGDSGARYIRRFGVAERRIFRVPYITEGVSFLPAQPTKAYGDVRRLLHVGQLTDRKGLMPFMEALSRYARENANRKIDLCFAGEGPLRPVLESIRIPSVSSSFLGTVPYKRLPEVYAHADILVFPTMADEWGLVVNEALAAGVPVLGSSYSQAVEELVEDGVNGWTFRPDHPEELRNALDSALGAPPDVLQSMREAAMRTVRDLTPEEGSKRILEAISFALEGSPDARFLPTNQQ